MQLTQLVYVSSYIDQYGFELPEFIEDASIGSDDLGVNGMTLFSNGNIIQLLEGRCSVVRRIFADLPMQAKQFGVIELLQEPVTKLCLDESSIGFSLSSLRLVNRIPSRITLFKLGVEQVRGRIRDCSGKTLMERFASDHCE